MARGLIFRRVSEPKKASDLFRRKFIRLPARGDLHGADETGPHDPICDNSRRLHAGIIPVKEQDDPREAGEQSLLVSGERRSHKSNDILVPGLPDVDAIKETLDDDNLV